MSAPDRNASVPATHDLRNRFWGHNVDFMRRQDDGSWQVCIWLSSRIREGDEVLVKAKGGGDLRYIVRGDVSRPVDPGDQHFATLVHESLLPEVTAPSEPSS